MSDVFSFCLFQIMPSADRMWLGHQALEHLKMIIIIVMHNFVTALCSASAFCIDVIRKQFINCCRCSHFVSLINTFCHYFDVSGLVPAWEAMTLSMYRFSILWLLFFWILDQLFFTLRLLLSSVLIRFDSNQHCFQWMLAIYWSWL